MKEIFVVGGLYTSEEKQEAEALLKQLGYKDDEGWNRAYRDEDSFNFISVQQRGVYSYHSHDCDPKPLITLTQLKSKAMKKDNVVIKAVTKEDGPRIMEYFKSIGVDTGSYEGTCYEQGGSNCIYYGIIQGGFQNWSLKQVELYSAEIVNLPKSKTVTWDREQFKSLHDMACSEWKPKLVKMFPEFSIKDKCGITEEQYLQMYGACTSSQVKLMDKIFGTHPFKNGKMFMCTRTLDDAFTKGEEYELVKIKSDGYVFFNNMNNDHTVTVGQWADYFYKID